MIWPYLRQWQVAQADIVEISVAVGPGLVNGNAKRTDTHTASGIAYFWVAPHIAYDDNLPVHSLLFR